MTVCRKCGQDPMEAAQRGAFLNRVNEKGVTGIWECSPTCEHKHGGQDDALLGALEAAVALPDNQVFSDEDVTPERMREKAEALWKILDNISTAGDAFKPDIADPFVNYVLRAAERKNEHFESDGYKLFVTK